MNGVLKVEEFERPHVDDADIREFLEAEAECERELRDLVRRCRLLLADSGPIERPPGHWLG
jgi:hypothetical protein